MKWVIAFILVGYSHFSYALLSPLSESVREIQTILQSPEIHHYLKESETILDIRKLQSSYIIVTNNYRMVVDINYLPSKKIGPQEFKLSFNEPVPL